MKKISIAIDGPSGAGKSSLAKAVARHYRFLYVDTGAIYRTLGVAVQRAGVSSKDARSVVALLPSVRIELSYSEDGTQRMILNGEDVTGSLRTPEVSIIASDVSAIPEVRAFLLDMQRDLARKHDVVMDGRDVGTVVLPDADVKIFLTADPAVRAERRRLELAEKGVKASHEEVLRDLLYRDEQDASRAAAPLRAAEDAYRLDNSALDFDGTVADACREISRKTGR